MLPNDTGMQQKTENSPRQPTKLVGKPLDTLQIPLLFLFAVGLLLAFRYHAKLTQAAAPPGEGIHWMTPDDYAKLSIDPTKDKRQLVLYDYTAAWCPPCKKLERTTFRNASVIKEVNSDFIPVRVDITTDEDAKKAETKKLLDKNDVRSIPRVIVTLRSGENVYEDSYELQDNFPRLLEESKKEAENVTAELAFARGDYVEALRHVRPERLQGTKAVAPYRAATYIMAVHLLKKMHRDAEVEPMMGKTVETTNKLNPYQSSSYKKEWLRDLNDYLRGKLSDKDVVEKAGSSSSGKYAAYMAIGLDKLMKGEKEPAIKNLREAKVWAAKAYSNSNLADFILREIDK